MIDRICEKCRWYEGGECGHWCTWPINNDGPASLKKEVLSLPEFVSSCIKFESTEKTCLNCRYFSEDSPVGWCTWARSHRAPEWVECGRLLNISAPFKNCNSWGSR